MAEEQVDQKPKLNISIVYEGTPITVKVKANMAFQKIFDVAAERFGKDKGTLRFMYEGARVRPDETPAMLNMEDGDQIDAHIEQLGGSLA
ncbi:unnamed protein product [Peniophora sp. CBMAI 1063]|nr:unnamed protein product [Peniophora sp. CBMAI 1063]